MKRRIRVAACASLGLLCLCGALAACQLPRPNVVPTRMIDVALAVEAPVADAANVAAVRLIDTQARGHLGRRLLHQADAGELTEDPVWRWSTTPDRYLDSAIRLAVAADPAVTLIDSSAVPALAATVIVWQLDTAGGRQLVAEVEVTVTGVDRAVRTEIVRAREPVSVELPGDLSIAASRLLRRLAGDILARVPGRATGK